MKPIFLLPALTAATLFLVSPGRAADAPAADTTPMAAADATPTDQAAAPGDANVHARNHEDFVKRFDTNGDGKLDDAEKAAAKATIRQERAARAEKMQSAMLKRYDKNGDGVLDASEQTAALADMETRPRFIRRFDKDGDGVLNAEEKANAEATMRAIWARKQVAQNHVAPAPVAPTAPAAPAPQ